MSLPDRDQDCIRVAFTDFDNLMEIIEDKKLSGSEMNSFSDENAIKHTPVGDRLTDHNLLVDEVFATETLGSKSSPGEMVICNTWIMDAYKQSEEALSFVKNLRESSDGTLQYSQLHWLFTVATLTANKKLT